jgi:predicted nuclease of predicted toxin-antitoxin system
VKILADENVDEPIVAWLRSSGHDVITMRDVAPGASDEDVVRLAEREHAIIVTSDRDFGELVFRRGLRPKGVVYLRLRPCSPEELLASFQRAWRNIEGRVENAFVVVTAGPIRIRPLA